MGANLFRVDGCGGGACGWGQAGDRGYWLAGLLSINGDSSQDACGQDEEYLLTVHGSPWSL
jgi:hypothetical protein